MRRRSTVLVATAVLTVGGCAGSPGGSLVVHEAGGVTMMPGHPG
jgi:Na+/H+-dicarboxylate symporter